MIIVFYEPNLFSEDRQFGTGQRSVEETDKILFLKYRFVWIRTLRLSSEILRINREAKQTSIQIKIYSKKYKRKELY